MGTYFKLITVLFLFSKCVASQNNTDQHLIKKGDNIYRLSLKYKVSMEALFALNPGSKRGIQIGNYLKIPEPLDKNTTKGNYC